MFNRKTGEFKYTWKAFQQYPKAIGNVMLTYIRRDVPGYSWGNREN